MTQSSSNVGIVYLIGAGPGDPGLITLRGLECLRQAGVVIYDRLANPLLLAYAGENAVLIDAGKEPEHHAVPQSSINQLLIEHARRGVVVARLKGGDPFVFGRGGEEAAALVEAGIPFEIVPGVSSAIAGPAYAGIPVTHRGLACSVAFATGHRAAEGGDPVCDWQRLADGPDTLVFLMGVHSLARIAEELIAHGRNAKTPTAVIAQASGPNQVTVTGPLAEIAGLAKARGVRAPAVIVVGEVVRLRETLRWFDLPERRPLLGTRIMVTSTRTRRAADMAPAIRRIPGTETTDLLHAARPIPCAGRVTDAIANGLARLGAEVTLLEVAERAEPDDPTALDLALHEIAAPPLSAGRAPRRSFGGWLVFSSPDAASFALDRFFRIGYDARALAGCKLHAADAATAARLLSYSLRPDQVGPANGSFRAGQRAFWLGGRVEFGQWTLDQIEEVPDPALLRWPGRTCTAAGGVTPADLCGYGLLVTEVPAFSLRAGQPHGAELAALREGYFTALVATSPQEVRFLARQLGEAGSALGALAAATTLICVDEETAEQARRSGGRADAVAGEDDLEDAVCAAVCRARTQR